MNLHKHTRDPVIWMNVTTSYNWNRPPVGIVRVEEALCNELEKLLGTKRFKRCTWQDGDFIESIPKSNSIDTKIGQVVDIIFPKTPSFDIPRKFLARAFEAFQKRNRIRNSTLETEVFEIGVPLNTNNPLRPASGDILISVGLDWDQPYTAEFFNLSKKRGIKIISCCYDLIPVLFPQYCVGDVATRFKEYFNILTWGSSAVLCISERTQKDYLELCSNIGAPKRLTSIIPLGDNVPENIGAISEQIQTLTAEPFILFVSTIERRKNHEVLYRAYHLLCEAGNSHLLPKMIFVGMPGWGVGDLLKDIELDPKTQNLIIQLNHVNDAELSRLYKHALFCVYPSLYEGWGLPVGEALAVGKAVLASNQGSLPEVGGDLVRYLEPWSARPWADAILELIKTPSLIRKMEQKVIENYNVRTWEDTAKAVNSLIEKIIGDKNLSEVVLYPGYDFSTQAGIPSGSTIQSTGQHGYLMFGPYRSLKVGQYKVTIYDDSTVRTNGKLIVDCVGKAGETCFWQGVFEIEKNSPNYDQPVIQFEFSVTEEVDDYEIRCIIDSANIVLTKVVLTDTTNLSRQVEAQSIPEKLKIIPNKELEKNLAWTKPVHMRQIFVDISELVNRDARTGIQRVVRSILSELIENPPAGFTIEPVYATSENGYRYARQFTWRFSDSPVTNLTDAPLKIRKGDIFLGLDLQPYLVPQQADFYSYLKLLGAEVYFIVYDLLPILTPNNFPEGTSDTYSQWLNTITQSDGAICISHAVADELSSWLSAYGPKRSKPFKLGWFHLGGDVLNSVPSAGLPSNAEEVLSKLMERPTFLVVGTLEPRKCQTQVLLAFEELWKDGIDINLVIVGKKGWLVDALADKIIKHTEKNSRLFWLDGISDEFLEKIYSFSTCLIAASEGEGFGLPLIEAAQYNKPIIARDIPVFREVAAQYAFYFSGFTSNALANGIREWLVLDQENRAPKSNLMPWLTWKKSTEKLLDIILNEKWHEQWRPDNVQRFWGSDGRMGTQVGERTGRVIMSTGRTGYLTFGPYIPLSQGTYIVKVFGTFDGNSVFGARVDVAAENGKHVLGECALSGSSKDDCLASLSVLVKSHCADLEIRIWVNSDTKCEVSMISIEPWFLDQKSSAYDLPTVETAQQPLNKENSLIAVKSNDANLNIFSSHPTSSEIPGITESSRKPSARRSQVKSKSKKNR